MLNILAAVLLFGLIVLIHEFGHFLFAKLNGIGVVEFSIGMGPRLLSTVRGETRYSIKILPFGERKRGQPRTLKHLTASRCGRGFR